MNTSEKQNKQRKSIVIVLCVMLLVVTTAILLDAFDVPSRMGLSTNNVNWGFQGTIIGAVITIGLFIITFLLIQRWDLKKQSNKHDVAIFLLKQTYEDCQRTVKFCEEQGIFKMMKTASDMSVMPESPAVALNRMSFPNDSTIMQLAMEGVLTAEQIQSYFLVKNSYAQHLAVRMMNYSESEKWHQSQKQLEDALSEANRTLVSKDKKQKKQR